MLFHKNEIKIDPEYTRINLTAITRPIVVVVLEYLAFLEVERN